MGEAVETMKAMREVNRQERRERHARWLVQNLALLKNTSIPFEERPNGVLLFRERGKPAVDFYASTGRWRVHGRSGGIMGGHAARFLDWYRKQSRAA